MAEWEVKMINLKQLLIKSQYETAWGKYFHGT